MCGKTNGKNVERLLGKIPRATFAAIAAAHTPTRTHISRWVCKSFFTIIPAQRASNNSNKAKSALFASFFICVALFAALEGANYWQLFVLRCENAHFRLPFQRK